jgi:GntR family transcriptional regulator
MPLIRDNATPLYRQIAAELREEIVAGHFEPSGRLPSEAALGARFRVSRVTVRLALNELSGSGMIDQRKGKGTYVAGRQVRHELDTLRSFHESLRLQGFDASMRLLTFELRPPPPAIQALFGQATPCLFLERLHLITEEPIAMGQSYLPADLAGISRAEAEADPTYAILSKLTGRNLERAHVTLGAQAADTYLEQQLHVQKGAALLRMERISYFADSGPAEYSVFYIRPERYRFTLNSYFDRASMPNG